MSAAFRRALGAAAALAGLMLATPSAAQSPEARIDAAASSARFAGVVLAAKGDSVIVRKSYDSPIPMGMLSDYEEPFDLGIRWRWASVTKQVIAVLIMQQVEAGRIDLDAPLSRYLPRFASANADKATVRQLLKHQAGLPNPDDSPRDGDALPAYYGNGYTGSRDPITGYCAGKPKAAPGGNWEYNNCDFIVAGALLAAVTGTPWPQLVAERIATPLKSETLNTSVLPDRLPYQFEIGEFGGRVPERPFDLSAFGASGGLFGTIDDLWQFDRALMTGKLIGAEALAQLWQSSPEQGFIAMGQWVYEVPIAGCDAPVRIVERRGSIGGTAVRNFILPDKDMVVIAFTNRGAFDSGFGEPWQGKGLSHDLISAAACPA